jgi:hypothetical protein
VLFVELFVAFEVSLSLQEGGIEVSEEVGRVIPTLLSKHLLNLAEELICESVALSEVTCVVKVLCRCFNLLHIKAVCMDILGPKSIFVGFTRKGSIAP